MTAQEDMTVNKRPESFVGESGRGYSGGATEEISGTVPIKASEFGSGVSEVSRKVAVGSAEPNRRQQTGQVAITSAVDSTNYPPDEILNAVNCVLESFNNGLSLIAGLFESPPPVGSSDYWMSLADALPDPV